MPEGWVEFPRAMSKPRILRRPRGQTHGCRQEIIIKARDSTVRVDAHGSRVSRAAGIKPVDAAIGISQEPVKAMLLSW